MSTYAGNNYQDRTPRQETMSKAVVCFGCSVLCIPLDGVMLYGSGQGYAGEVFFCRRCRYGNDDAITKLGKEALKIYDLKGQSDRELETLLALGVDIAKAKEELAKLEKEIENKSR